MTEKGEVPPVGVKPNASHLLDEHPNHSSDQLRITWNE